MKNYKSNNNIVFLCTYHVIWVVKYRKNLLSDTISERLKKICDEVAKETATEIISIETDKNHIHLVLSVDPQFGINKVVKKMKGSSSRILRSEFPILKSRVPTLWTNSYFVCTIGGAPLSVLKKYVESQRLRSP